ncbi:MAG TPA: hypothetical protein VJQ54_17660 [Candidatus Sulfotelmatobacter sp.]|nr:hypothetical protein [Candidatus Sulfotelmatobacter sp.]
MRFLLRLAAQRRNCWVMSSLVGHISAIQNPMVFDHATNPNSTSLFPETHELSRASFDDDDVAKCSKPLASGHGFRLGSSSVLLRFATAEFMERNRGAHGAFGTIAAIRT